MNQQFDYTTYKTYVTTPRLLEKEREKKKVSFKSHVDKINTKKNWKLIAPKITETQKLLYQKSLAVDTGFILITSGAKER